VGGRASVTKDEKRVLRGSWTVMSLCRYEGWVVAVVYWGYTRVYGVYQPPGFLTAYTHFSDHK